MSDHRQCDVYAGGPSRDADTQSPGLPRNPFIVVSIIGLMFLLLAVSGARADTVDRGGDYWRLFTFSGDEAARVSAPDYFLSAEGMAALPILDMGDRVGLGYGGLISIIRRTNCLSIGADLGVLYFSGREISLVVGTDKSTEYFLTVPLMFRLGFPFTLPWKILLEPAFSIGASFDVLSFNPTGASYLGNTSDYEMRYELHPAVRAEITLGIPMTESVLVNVTPSYLMIMEFFESGFTKLRTSNMISLRIGFSWRI